MKKIVILVCIAVGCLLIAVLFLLIEKRRLETDSCPCWSDPPGETEPPGETDPPDGEDPPPGEMEPPGNE